MTFWHRSHWDKCFFQLHIPGLTPVSLLESESGLSCNFEHKSSDLYSLALAYGYVVKSRTAIRLFQTYKTTAHRRETVSASICTLYVDKQLPSFTFSCVLVNVLNVYRRMYPYSGRQVQALTLFTVCDSGGTLTHLHISPGGRPPGILLFPSIPCGLKGKASFLAFPAGLFSDIGRLGAISALPLSLLQAVLISRRSSRALMTK
jgi:hypothetical protein